MIFGAITRPGAAVKEAHDGIRPPPERLQHDQIEHVADVLSDAEGRISRPMMVVDLLIRLERSGVASKVRIVADASRDCFRRSGLDRLRATDPEQPFIGTGRLTSADQISDEKARRHIALLLARAGGMGRWGGRACGVWLGARPLCSMGNP